MYELFSLERKVLKKYCELENIDPAMIYNLSIIDRNRNETGIFTFFHEKAGDTIYRKIPDAFVGKEKTLIGFLLYRDSEVELVALECFIADASEKWPVDDYIVEFDSNS